MDTKDMKGENIARLELRPQAEARVLVSPLQGNGPMATMEIRHVRKQKANPQAKQTPHSPQCTQSSQSYAK
jgi:hypothetical protein